MQKITAFKGTITGTSKWAIEVKSVAKKQLSLNVYGPWSRRLLKKQAGTLKQVSFTGWTLCILLECQQPTLSILHEYRCIFNITNSPQMAP
jgi:hypothetical protein